METGKFSKQEVNYSEKNYGFDFLDTICNYKSSTDMHLLQDTTDKKCLQSESGKILI